MIHQPLTAADYAQMDAALNRFHGERAMNLEALDGFFAALICCPDTVMPSEYLPELWGGRGPVFHTVQEWQAFMGLVTHYWGVMADTLDSGATYLPLVLEDKHGNVHGNDWAAGFLRGMALRRDTWSRLLTDATAAEALAPIFVLAYEHDPDPDLWPCREPVDEAQRVQLLAAITASVAWIHRTFGPDRRRVTPSACGDLCPCGLGAQCRSRFDGVVLH
jgi:uncharacterized protein